MLWYSAGSVSVTLGSATVTGLGTSFITGARIGDAFSGPDGRWYAVANIVSATVMAIEPAYKGATASAQAYAIAPIQGYVKESADKLRGIVEQWGGVLAAASDESQGLPAVIYGLRAEAAATIAEDARDAAALSKTAAAESAATATAKELAATNSAVTATTQATAASESAGVATAKEASAVDAAGVATAKAGAADASAIAAAEAEAGAAEHVTATGSSAAAASGSAAASLASAGSSSASAAIAIAARDDTQAAQAGVSDSALAASDSADESSASALTAAADKDATLTYKNDSAASAGVSQGAAADASASSSAASASATAADSSASITLAARDTTLSARDEAVLAASALTGNLSELGAIDLSSGAYPAPPDSAGFWKVTVGGTVGGVNYGFGDTLVYSKNMLAFYKIDNTESVSSVAGVTGAVSRADLGIDQLDNTADSAKPVSTAQATALALKVDKAASQSLMLDEERDKLAGVQAGAQVNAPSGWGNITGELADQADLTAALAGKALWLPSRLFAKAAPNTPAWIKSGSALVTSQVINVAVGVVAVAHAAGTAITLPTLVVGSDYAIYATQDGRLIADLNWSAPSAEPAGTTRKLGGFHVALTGEIFEFSLWDLNYRPTCADPRGMVCIAGASWYDIYLLGVNHITDGTSRAGVTIADGSSPPKIPMIFGGNGSLAYANCTWFVAQDVLRSHGKSLPTWGEFATASFGVAEGTSVGADPVTTKADLPRRSRWGVEQATGNLWQWGADVQGNAGGAWAAITDGRGSVYHSGCTAVILGASWGDGGGAGSRSASWSSAPSGSVSYFGVRGRSDHLLLQAER